MMMMMMIVACCGDDDEDNDDEKRRSTTFCYSCVGVGAVAVAAVVGDDGDTVNDRVVPVAVAVALLLCDPSFLRDDATDEAIQRRQRGCRMTLLLLLWR